MAAVDPSNPQTWNQYAYVGGNPLNFTDPTGMQQCQNGHAGCPPAQSPKYFIDGPFGPITCTLDGVPVPCGTAQQIAGSGAAAQIPGTGLPIAGNNGKLYQPVLTGDGAGYINPNNGEVFYGGSEFGLPNPNLNSTMNGLPQGTGPWLALAGFWRNPSAPSNIVAKYKTRPAPIEERPVLNDPIWPTDPEPEIEPGQFIKGPLPDLFPNPAYISPAQKVLWILMRALSQMNDIVVAPAESPCHLMGNKNCGA